MAENAYKSMQCDVPEHIRIALSILLLEASDTTNFQLVPVCTVEAL
jgi:hypothetical protein